MDAAKDIHKEILPIAAKDIHKEMLPIWAAFPCGYLCFQIFCPHKKRTTTGMRMTVQT
jgi:hypothetical protein